MTKMYNSREGYYKNGNDGNKKHCTYIYHIDIVYYIDAIVMWHGNC